MDTIRQERINELSITAKKAIRKFNSIIYKDLRTVNKKIKAVGLSSQ